jgi:DNA-binding LytR/AlgR family response regulator
MNILVVEDELPARGRLLAAIRRVDATATVVGVEGSVAGARRWLAEQPAPDVMFLDIQLSDGLSFKLFEDGSVHVPVIFTTAYDRFALDAYDANAIGYILKPICDDAVAKALGGYSRLRRHFDSGVVQAIAELARHAPKRRQRVISHEGSGFVPLPIEDIAYFVSLDKSLFAIDRDGTRHMLDGTLADLDRELDKESYFRLTRQVIVAAAAVAGYRSVGKGCLAVQLRPGWHDSVVVPQERAAAFKAWLGS